MAQCLRGPASTTTGAFSGHGGSNGINFTLSFFRPCMRQRCHYLLNGRNLPNHKTTDGCPPPLRLVHPCASLARDAATFTAHENYATSSDADDELADRAEAESEQILEWPAVCKQVACFCGTSVAADLVARGNLPRGRSREESEVLLQQTAEAAEANLEVRGCFDIRPAVEAAAAGACLNAKQLEGVASTLEAAFTLQVAATVPEQAKEDPDPDHDPDGDGDDGASTGSPPRLRQGRRRYRFPALAALAGGIGDEERTTLRAIRACIKLSSVSSDASEALAAVRAERAANKEALRAEVESWARLMVSRGAAEPGAVSLVRGRFCVGVRAGRQGELPKGSVRLSASSTGATLYVEPAPCVPLNNAEALLAEREEGEVTRVLALLSKLLGSRAAQVLLLLDSVTSLDVVAARARHSRWLGGVRPSFETGPGASPLHVPGARHPVLMQRGLPPLPQPPSVDDNRFDRDFQAAGAWELRRVLLPDGPRPGEMPDGSTAGEGEGGGGADSLLPRPLDLRVPAGRTIVAITGPNTGGKTVSLKAAGLMVLMAQAGLYLPCDPAALATHGSPRLAWFDRVLADIGDAQSLQQNLSTFSGHIRRIRQILAAAGPRSLVLLDEVGSGTDPLEGAALARAVLDRLAGQAHLTLATTHHAELKRAADEDPRFVNCSMAFDTATLRPTYVLSWGAAGASNALDIAEALGFDRSVVLEARSVAQALAASASASSSSSPNPSASSPASSSERDSHIAVVARSLVRQLDETRQELEAQQALRRRREESRALLQETLSQVREMEQQLKLSPREIVMERDSLAAEVQSALDAFAAGLQPQAPVEEALRRIEALIPEEVAAYRGQAYGGGGGDDDDPDGEDPQALRPGDSVHVRSYGDMGSAKVLSVKGDYVTVKFDLMLPLGARSGRSKRFHKREVQRVSRGAAGPLLGTSAWMYDKYTGLESDIRRVLGQLSAGERAAAEEAAARMRSQRMVVQEAGLASYGDLYNALDVDQLSEDLDEQIIEDPDLASLVDSLEQEDDEDADEADAAAAAWSRRRRGGPSSSSSGPAAATGPKRAAAVAAAAAAAAAARTRGRSDGDGEGGASSSSMRGGEGEGGGGVGGLQFGVPESTADNTVDLAGEVPELAAADLDDRIRDEPPGSVLFVRHGLGTGAVRDAVHQVLARRSSPRGRVLEWREAPGSRGEVTVVWLT